MAVVIKQDVLGFEITVDNVELVQRLQRQQELGTVETSAILVEPVLALQVMEQLSTIDKAIKGMSVWSGMHDEKRKHTQGRGTASAQTGS